MGFDAIHRAIELNTVQVEFNRACFLWGRRMAINPAAVEKVSGTTPAADGTKVIEFAPRHLERVEDIVKDRSQRLSAYQSQALADRYAPMVQKASDADAQLGAKGRFEKAVARYYYKLLAEKDEFEVARLYSDPAFRKDIDTQFEGDFKVTLNLWAWPFAKRDPMTGELRKREMGGWIFPAMKVLQAIRGIRNTWLDPFRNSPKRTLARELLTQHEQDLDLIFARAGQRVSGADGSAAAIALAALPEKIRGYGHVRRAHAEKADPERENLRMKLLDREGLKGAA